MISSSGALPERSGTARAAAHDRRAPASRRSPGGGSRAARRGCRASGWSPTARARARAVLLELARGPVVTARCARRSSSLRHLLGPGQELVQRRVEQPDRDRQSRHLLEQALEVVLLERQQLVERGAAVLLGLGHDHRPHLRLAVRRHEHVLGAAEADALGAELARLARRPPGCRRWRARRACGSRRPSRAPARSWDPTSGSTSGTSSAVTMPAPPSIAIRSPSRSTVPFDAAAPAPSGRPRAPAAPDTHGLPIPRATSAAWLALPPSEVRMPSRGVEAGHVVGLGERPHQDHVAARPRPPPRPRRR